MSKFANLMHLLDVKNHEIKDREFPVGLKPFFKQQVCVIPLLPAELNERCLKCVFADLVTTKGKVDEFGIGGYMSNQKDGLAPTKMNMGAKVTLKEPRTIIIAEGQAWRCKNLRNRMPGFLTEKTQPCEYFMEKYKEKK